MALQLSGQSNQATEKPWGKGEVLCECVCVAEGVNKKAIQERKLKVSFKAVIKGQIPLSQSLGT